MIQTQDHALVVVVGTIKDPAVKIAQITLLLRHELADFHRTSIIKTSLRNCCPDVNLQRVIKDAVMQTRTLTYLDSLFVQLLIVSRIHDNLPVPPLTHLFSTMYLASW